MVIKRHLIDALAVLVLGILLSLGWLAERSISAAAESDRWQSHTYVVIDELVDLFSSLKDAETGQRGFIITGDQPYLEPYRASLAEISTRLAALRRLTADNPSQQQRLAAITPLVAQRLAFAKKTIALRETEGFQAASAAVATGEGKAIMDDLRALLGQAKQEEERILQARIATKQADIRKSILILELGGTLSSLALLGLFFFLRRQLGRRHRAEAHLRELNATLERRVLERTQALGESERRHKRATDDAVSANRAKTDFLSTISHEIRTPLNGMLGLTELLLTEQLTPQQRQYAALAQVSGKTLLALVNDLLDIGKIEAGQLDVEHIPFNLTELLSELTELYTLRAHEKSLVFLTQKAPGVPMTLLGDPGHLRQILNNLLANALKFTHHGEIGLSVERLSSDGHSSAHSCRLRFSVHDSGIGIAAEAQTRLFTRFTQIDRSITSEYGGSGLGLAIVKQLCEHLGGAVALTSTPGQGSVFSCVLPFTLVAQTVPVPVPTPVPVPVPSATRILMAEDNAINQMVARAQLKSLGFMDVTVVDNGQEAVDAVVKGGFDLVLMDCRMPVLDGYGATEQLRAQGYLLPIIAMTANAAAADREKCLQLGMNDYLSKPFNIATLGETLARWKP